MNTFLDPYAKQLKRQITIRLDTVAVAYFKGLTAELGMPDQELVTHSLRSTWLTARPLAMVQRPSDLQQVATGNNPALISAAGGVNPHLIREGGVF